MSSELEPSAEPENEPADTEVIPPEGEFSGIEVSASAWISNFPLPPPEILGEYEREVPGTSGRFWESIHQEQQNRHQFYMHNADLTHRRIGSVIRGQAVIGLVAVLGMIALAIVVFLVVGAGYGTAITIVELFVSLVAVVRRAGDQPQDDEADQTS